MICPNCKNEIPEGSKFCLHCGAKSEPEKKKANFCMNCGSALENDSKFCKECGAKVIEFEPRKKEAPEAPKPTTSKPGAESTAGSSLTVVCLTLAAIALIIACAVVIPKRLKESKKPSYPVEIDENYPGYSSDSSEAQEVRAQAERVRASANNETEDSAEITENTDTDTLSSETAATQAETEAPATEQLSTETTAGADRPAESGTSESSVGRPSIEDFKYMVERDSGTIPGGGVLLTRLEDFTGDWKAYIQYTSPDYDGTITRLLNIRIEDGGNSVSAVWDWYQISKFGAPFEEEHHDLDIFTGSYIDGSIFLSGRPNITFEAFYTFEGKEYAIGSLYFDDSSTTAIINMVRP